MRVATSLWNSKPVSYVRAVSEIYGIVSLIALGASVVLGVLVPAFVDEYVSLGFLEKTALVVGVFILVFACGRALAQPIKQGRASLKGQLAEKSIELETAQEELQSVKREHDQFKTTIESQEERLAKWEGARERFKAFLRDAWTEGIDLRGSDPTQADARDWESKARTLIEWAVGEESANYVLEHDPNFRSGDFDATGAQKFLEMRLQNLDAFMKHFVQRDAVPFRPDFDPYDWKDWKTPPRDVSEAIANRKELERLKSDKKRRMQFRDVLNAAYEEGTDMMLDAGLGADAKFDFLHPGPYVPTDEITLDQLVLDAHLERLSKIIRQVDSLESLDVQPDFNPEAFGY